MKDKQALAAFLQAAHELLDCWSESIDKGYPDCLPSFDEFVAQLDCWYEEVNK